MKCNFKRRLNQSKLYIFPDITPTIKYSEASSIVRLINSAKSLRNEIARISEKFGKRS